MRRALGVMDRYLVEFSRQQWYRGHLRTLDARSDMSNGECGIE